MDYRPFVESLVMRLPLKIKCIFVSYKGGATTNESHHVDDIQRLKEKINAALRYIQNHSRNSRTANVNTTTNSMSNMNQNRVNNSAWIRIT